MSRQNQKSNAGSNRNAPGSPRKILIMGLDNSGKTSILLSLKGVKNLLSFFNLTPTSGIEIENLRKLDTQFSIWDFGGQEVYRGEYLRNFKEHAIQSDKIIFVIDIQDKQRYPHAVEYLGKIARQCLELEKVPDLSVFLHKLDPDLEKNPEFQDEVLNQELLVKIRSTIPRELSYKVFRTTIYTIFRKGFLRIY